MEDDKVETVLPLPWWAVLIAVALTPLVWGCASISPYQEPRAAVRLISNDFGNGSVVVIAPNLMLTAGHVAVQESSGLFVDGKPAKTLRIDSTADLAIMAAEVACPCATIAAYPVEVDEAVIVVGFPFNHGYKAQAVTTGRVQGVSEGLLRLSAPAAGGNSGGGVFVRRDGQWQLVGILVSGMGQVSHLTMAVDLVTIRKFLVL